MTRRDDEYWINRYTPKGPGFFDGLTVELQKKPKPKPPTRQGPSLTSLVPVEVKGTLGLAVMIGLIVFIVTLVMVVT